MVFVALIAFLPTVNFVVSLAAHGAVVALGQSLLKVETREVVADAHLNTGLQVVAPGTGVHLVHTVPPLSLKYPSMHELVIWSVFVTQLVLPAVAPTIVVQASHSLAQFNQVPGASFAQSETHLSAVCAVVVPHVVEAALPFTLWYPLSHATTCELSFVEHVSAEPDNILVTSVHFLQVVEVSL